MSDISYKISDLSFSYRNKDGSCGYTVKLPELLLKSGQVMCITGVSGCGKSTLLECLGLLRNTYSAATQIIGDMDIFNLSVKKRNLFASAYLGYMPQTGGLVPYLSFRDNLALQIKVAAGALHTLTKERADTDRLMRDILNSLDEFSMSDLIDRYPHELSIGQRQRAVFFKTLCHRPKVLLIDEPTSSLDPEHGELLFSNIVKMSQEQGISALVVTHDLSLVNKFSLPSLDYRLSEKSTGEFVLKRSQHDN
ncbi:MAG: ATP-binding cassette domain-containing protein [Succinivibrio sp.]